jgi:hypothetical protein
MLWPARRPGHVRHVIARIAPSHTAAASSKDVPDGFAAIGALSWSDALVTIGLGRPIRQTRLRDIVGT